MFFVEHTTRPVMRAHHLLHDSSMFFVEHTTRPVMRAHHLLHGSSMLFVEHTTRPVMRAHHLLHGSSAVLYGTYTPPCCCFLLREIRPSFPPPWGAKIRP
jgi:hypothetical protein